MVHRVEPNVKHSSSISSTKIEPLQKMERISPSHGKAVVRGIAYFVGLRK